MSPDKPTDINVARKRETVDRHLALSDRDEKTPPLFSLIEFNLTGLCTRTCAFCPRHDPRLFPNVNEHMLLGLFEKIVQELGRMDYSGLLLFSGFSEPLLHPQIEEVLRLARLHCPQARLELVSNGDPVDAERLAALVGAGLDTIIISMYDGPHQEEKFSAMRQKAGLSQEQVVLRVRWLPAEESFGIILTNRGGLAEIPQAGVKTLTQARHHPCYYPFHMVMIDHDGLAPLCTHDWGRKLVIGDLNRQSLMELWTSDALRQVRLELAQGRRSQGPCRVCDADGTLTGGGHMRGWLSLYGVSEPESEEPRLNGD